MDYEDIEVERGGREMEGMEGGEVRGSEGGS